MKYLLLIATSHVQVAVWFLLLSPALVLSLVPRPDCQRRCGGVEIHYPFGIGQGCARDEAYEISCDTSYDPARPYFLNAEVISITPETSEMRVFSSVAHICYNSSRTFSSRSSWIFKFGDHSPFRMSPEKNEFTGIGCNTLALLRGRDTKKDGRFKGGCLTTCASLSDAAASTTGGNCTGNGCCQTPTPRGLEILKFGWGPKGNAKKNAAWNYSSCSHALVAEKGWYKFNITDLEGTDRDPKNKKDLNGTQPYYIRVGERTVPLVLDWAIATGGNDDSNACVSKNSQRSNASEGQGYLCQCLKGYDGNPYLDVTGYQCEDINECELRKSNPTKYEIQYPCVSGSTCHNMPGGYKCKCNLGYIADGKTGCWNIIPYAIAIAAIFVSIVVACFAIVSLKRRKQRDRFSKHGGDLLKDVGINIFSEGQLKKITNGYKNTIGEGAFGKVYMGTIDDAQHVAVKCSNAKGQALPQEEFRNEIIFQFRISHRNVVRLVGCCLETDVPMLVFEFVPNGSLYSVLHNTNKQTHTLPLLKRLDIAIGSAEALAHMHSHVGHNHVHGDVKSGNILLDDQLMPKVSDFGSSKLLTIGYTRSVSADMNYIDPVCMKTGRLTEKSDVYSFGVVLLELVTRKTAKYDKDKSLPIDFIKFCKEEGNGRAMYDRDILTTDDDTQAHAYLMCLDKIGALAVQCLKEDVDERPTIAEVVVELKQAKIIGFGGPCSEAT